MSSYLSYPEQLILSDNPSLLDYFVNKRKKLTRGSYPHRVRPTRKLKGEDTHIWTGKMVEKVKKKEEKSSEMSTIYLKMWKLKKIIILKTEKTFYTSCFKITDYGGKISSGILSFPHSACFEISASWSVVPVSTWFRDGMLMNNWDWDWDANTFTTDAVKTLFT